jgi:hypothetical protein
LQITDNQAFNSTSTSGVSSKDPSPSFQEQCDTSFDNLDKFVELRIVESCDRLDRNSVLSVDSSDSDVTICVDHGK